MKVINYQLALDYMNEVHDAILKWDKATPLHLQATSECIGLCKKMVYDLLSRMDTIDTECVIRCSWCEYRNNGVCNKLNTPVDDHFYCAYGKQKNVRGTIKIQSKEDK